MLQVTRELKEKVVAALMLQRANYDGSDTGFAKLHGIGPAVYNRLKGGEREKLIAEAKWLNLGRELGVSLNERKWNMARTEVYNIIEEEVLFCKEYSKSRIFADDCGIGKTYTAKYLSRTVQNCFYLDASQYKTKNDFIRGLAKAVGVGDRGRISDMKENTKYYLQTLPKPIVVIDEAGDLNYAAFLELKEFWNATDGCCGWYLMGADGLREKMERGIRNKKVGFAEMFSRHSEKYSTAVPFERNEKIAFYKKLITEVLTVNMTDKTKLSTIVNRCLTADETGHIGGLRRAESLLILNS
ncbi:hypothetical protein AGMMS4956_09610 [Bacteroidia bacterium]|nr:hypothetical protein AGMMS4956_09610 [Bacteroidia bacterium]